VRKALDRSPLKEVLIKEAYPGDEVQTDEEILQYIVREPFMNNFNLLKFFLFTQAS
jgi:hypothetical protein